MSSVRLFTGFEGEVIALCCANSNFLVRLSELLHLSGGLFCLLALLTYALF